MSYFTVNRPSHRNLKIGLWVAVGFLSLIFGLLAAIAKPLLIVAAAGAVFTVVLLALPEFTIWLVLVMGFLFGIVSASPKFSKFAWGISILCTLLFLPVFTNMIAWTKQRITPGFIKLAIFFLVYCLFISVFQCYSLSEFVGGFKHYFQTFGLMLALILVPITANTYGQWLKFLFVIALLQFPFALYELVILVPQRHATGGESTDVVAGTFGANMEGGSPNAVMVIYLFVVLAFLVARKRAGLFDSKSFYLVAFFCLMPLGMGETKIAVVMLPLVGLVLLRKDLKHSFKQTLPAIIGVIIITMLLCYLYVTVIMHSTFEKVWDATLRYNVGEQGYSRKIYLNRLTSVTFWFQHQGFDDPVSFLIGNGLGSSFSSTEGVSGHLGLKYPHYGINLTAVSTLLWDTGVLGLALFTSIFVAAWRAADRLIKEVNDRSVQADALAIQASIALFLLSLIYNDYIVNLLSMELVYVVVLGYLGYLMNRYGLFGKSRARSSEINGHHG